MKRLTYTRLLSPALAWASVAALAGIVVLLLWRMAAWIGVAVAGGMEPPPPRARIEPVSLQHALEKVVDADLFGAVARAGGDTAPAADGLRLIAILAAVSHGASLATLSVNGQAAGVFAEGEAIAPQLKLERIAPDHVLVNRGGTVRRLELIPKGS